MHVRHGIYATDAARPTAAGTGGRLGFESHLRLQAEPTKANVEIAKR